jgi:hypothetical protein
MTMRKRDLSVSSIPFGKVYPADKHRESPGPYGFGNYPEEKHGMKYLLDDADVFDLFHTFRDFQVLQMRMERVLKHIGFPTDDDKRHEDTSYAGLVKKSLQRTFRLYTETV